MLSEAFSFVRWSTIPPIPLKAILDPLKCQIEAFYCNNQKPHYYLHRQVGVKIFNLIFFLIFKNGKNLN